MHWISKAQWDFEKEFRENQIKELKIYFNKQSKMKAENLEESINIIDTIKVLDEIKKNNSFIAHQKNSTIQETSSMNKRLNGEYRKAINTINKIANLLIKEACDNEIKHLKEKLELL
jgi:predicted dithiol-disulfide oxidoreductase (DUF899 family)